MKYQKLNIIGQMSGTSLDGLDLALCEFETINDKVRFKLIYAETIPYSSAMKTRLNGIYSSSANEYFALNFEYGKYISEQILSFKQKTNSNVDFLSLHGHTIFHKPELGYTTQIGCASTICARTNINTIYGFRNMDVAQGGQGAPLVPIGDRDLFPEFESCLNIGGIANISFDNYKKERIAFDICLANILLNYLSLQLGKEFDDSGNIAKSGSINHHLLNQLLEIDYPKKSIGREEFEKEFKVVLDSTECAIENKLRTCVEYIAMYIAQTLKNNHLKSVLITGGGVYNDFLIECIQKHFDGKIEIPDDNIIQYKEAIVFAYLGYLFMNKEINCLKTVTGANKNSIGGNLCLAYPTLL
jgi:anhydro-N-acetylmuramic acid kinase